MIPGLFLVGWAVPTDGWYTYVFFLLDGCDNFLAIGIKGILSDKKGENMLAKMTSKNQITIPKKIIEQFPATDYFDIDIKDGVVRMKPVKLYDTDLDRIRDKINRLNL